MVYAATLSEYQRVMRRRLIIEGLGPNIQHISGVDNIVANTLIKLPTISVDKYETGKSEVQFCANGLFSIGRVENIKDFFPLNILNFQREQQK